jgi:ABC-type Fe3+ transport system substrate-binding protein
MVASSRRYSTAMFAAALPRILIALALAAILGVPMLFRPATATAPAGAVRLNIITPHNEQIRYEFEHAFDRWHREHHGQPAAIEWVTTGGTTEIRRQLQSIYRSAILSGRFTAEGTLSDPSITMPYDLLFGGGSYEHTEMKKGVTARPPGADADMVLPISVPVPFDQARLDAWFGPNEIGPLRIYEPEGYWLGVAASGFGIVYNRDVLAMLGVPEPTTWTDLTDPRLFGWVAMTDPNYSGSVATLYESIMNAYGWDDGWALLRRMSAGAPYFSNNSKKVALDVSRGEAAVGTSIDFFGRYESQAMQTDPADPLSSRVGYVDPPGVVLIDPDPITMLRGGPNPTTAARFIEFLLTDEGQAIWQFPARRSGASEPEPGVPPGPERFEIRRLPIQRGFIERWLDRCVDKVDPYAIVSKHPSLGFRGAIVPMFRAMVVDTHHDLRLAWRAILDARATPGFPPDVLAEMERLFDAMPEHTLADGTTLPFNGENCAAITRDLKIPHQASAWRIHGAAFFRDTYRRIADLAHPHLAGAVP